MRICSVSGGKTSAYLFHHYDWDHGLFALVRTSDKRCRFKDRVLASRVEDLIQMPFNGTLESDEIIHTIFDLEQCTGKRIQWVSGVTFDELIQSSSAWLPNKLHRYCTTQLKIVPMFQYWWSLGIDPVQMGIGFRYSEKEMKRMNKMKDRLNDKGYLEMRAHTGTWLTTSNKGCKYWAPIPWQQPVFSLITDKVSHDKIVAFWQDKNIRFADYNNCVHCFHRHPLLLRLMFDKEPNKMSWAKDMEDVCSGQWRSDVSYSKIQSHSPQVSLDFDDFSDCDSGYCNP